MSELPLSVLFAILALLLVLSGAFSGSETGIMTLNRYRLRHLAKSGHRGARLASRLLRRPDRLIGLILLGNNFVNILASSIATLIALRLGGESAIAVATFLLTLVVLIFSEVTPKTLAALYPERIAFPAAYALSALMRVLYPLVWVVNGIVNAMLRTVGIKLEDSSGESLSRDELRTVVNEAGAMIPRRHQKMLLGILDLDNATVEDIMVPRADIVGIDLDDSWEDILEDIEQSQYTRLPVYRGTIDNVVGFLHLRKILRDLATGRLDREVLMERVREPYFIPEGTPLNVQLVNFQRNGRRSGLVVDEYGEILGLATLEDILEEIVGEFTTDPAASIKEVQPQDDGSFIVEGGASIRELNRIMDWQLPTDGPKTLNGLILEHMETIPEAGTTIMLQGFPVTILQVKNHKVRTARVVPSAPES